VNLRALFAGALLLLLAVPGAWAQEDIPFPKFGTVKVYPASGTARDLIIHVSDRDGWSAEDDTLAKVLAADGHTVAGIDYPAYAAAIDAQPGSCMNGDFEQLARHIEKDLPFGEFRPPYMTGVGAGAFVSWAATMTALPNTFNSWIGIGFRPVSPLAQPICLKDQMVGTERHYAGVKGKETPWLFTPAAEFDAVQQKKFLDETSDAAVLPANGDPKQLILEGIKRTETYNQREKSMSDIPTIELPPKDGVRTGRPLVVFFSGDGGWRDIDRQIGGFLADDGQFVVGLDLLKYFWRKKDADRVARDVERIIQRYQSVWRGKGVILAGFSLGAEVLPAVYNRLHPSVRDQVKLMTLLGPGTMADFEIYLTSYLGMQSGRGAPIEPEMRKIQGVHVQCVYGADEKDSLCIDKSVPITERLAYGKDHHFGYEYRKIANEVSRAAVQLGLR
jgi:type IV secretory pathway VirJ component